MTFYAAVAVINGVIEALYIILSFERVPSVGVAVIILIAFATYIKIRFRSKDGSHSVMTVNFSFTIVQIRELDDGVVSLN